MNTKLIKFFIFVSLLFFSVESVSSQEVSGARFVKERVAAIEVRGNSKVADNVIRLQVKTQPGSLFNPSKVSNDIKNVYLTGFFDEVSAKVKRGASGVSLLFLVKEKPSIRNFEISGSDKVSEKVIKEKLGFDSQQFLDKRKLALGVEELKKHYQSEGFYGTEIAFDSIPISNSEVDFKLAIDEGIKKVLSDIDFKGVSAFDAEELRDVIATRRYKWYSSWLTGSGVVKQEIVDTDVQLLTQHYLKNGYADVKISKPEVLESADEDDEIRLVFNIREGQQYRFGSISATGDVLAEGQRQTLDGIKSKSGEVFNVEFLRGDTFHISEKFTNIGYAFANVEPQTAVRRDAGLIDISFKVNKGETIHINQILISGNHKTFDNVIRRSLNIGEGELYDGSKIKRSEQLLRRLGYFDEVTIVSEPTSDKNRVNLNVGVREGQTGTFSIGAGVSSGDGFIVSGRVSENNLFGTGNSLTLDINTGARRDNFVLSFSNPRVNDTRWSFGADILNVNRVFNEFERGQTGGSLTVGYPLWFLGNEYLDDVRFSFGYEFTRISIDEVEETAPALVLEQEGKSTSSSIIPRLVRNTIDNPLDPTKGSRQVLRLEFAGLGGDEKFWLAQFNNTWYYPLWETSVGDITFSQRTRFGWGQTFDNDSFPLFRRFFPGGINSLRGFEAREVGPQDENGNEFGGSKQLITNFEVIFPLISSAGLRGVAFYDAGNAFDDDESINFDNLRHAVGWGLRWRSPIAPIRIEIGYPLNREDGDKSVVTNFSFGAPL